MTQNQKYYFLNLRNEHVLESPIKKIFENEKNFKIHLVLNLTFLFFISFFQVCNLFVQ